PWESFYKDVILMVFVSHLFWYRKKYTSTLRTMEGYAVMGAVIAVSLFLGVYAVQHLPFIDFRAYKVGNVIPQQMIPEEQPVIEYLFDKNGETVASKDFLSEDDGYKYVSSRVLNEDKITPKITDYLVTSPDGEDLTQYTFEGAKLMIIMYDVGKASTENIEEIKELAKALDGTVDTFVLTSSGAEQMEAFRHENQLAVPYYYADATVLKTILRSNPGLALWKDGKVLGNWHHNDAPDAEEIRSLLR
ncbi:MAG: DoxX family protein, partial [Cyclobacteriaceae bacterium]